MDATKKYSTHPKSHSQSHGRKLWLNRFKSKTTIFKNAHVPSLEEHTFMQIHLTCVCFRKHNGGSSDLKNHVSNVRDQALWFLHPGRLTWNLQITHLERKMIFQTSMIMFHVNLQGCNSPLQWKHLSVRQSWFYKPTICRFTFWNHHL